MITPHHPAYPRRLFEMEEPPPIEVSGAVGRRRLDDASLFVAIVGARKADETARNWAHQLAFHLARAGVVVVSGGAKGIDQAAHMGAMKAGATWCVACAGREAPAFPSEHVPLFGAIERSESSRMVWPFPPHTRKTKVTPRQRNKVLVGLADAVVVVQARIQSGSMNAANHAIRMGRPIYAVTGRPWDYAFLGSTKLILDGTASPLSSMEQLFSDLGLPRPEVGLPESVLSDMVPQQPALRSFKRRGRSYASDPQIRVDPDLLPHGERQVFTCLSRAPLHQDRVIEKAGLEVSTALTALLTLSLKNVVVEGPDGFFRLRTGP